MVLQREKMKGDITQWSGGSCLSNVLGDKEGRASHPLCALIPLTPTTLLAVWVQNQLQQLYAVEYRAEQYQLQWNVYSTQQSTKCMASQPAHLTSHLSQQGSSGGTQHSDSCPAPTSRAEAVTSSFQLFLPFPLKSSGTHSSTKYKLQPVLLYIQFAQV